MFDDAGVGQTQVRGSKLPGGNVSQMEVILQAIQYIQDLQGRLGFQEMNRLKSVVPNCQGEDVSHMEIILQAIDYLKDLQKRLGHTC